MNLLQAVVDALCEGISATAGYVLIDRENATIDTGYDVIDVEAVAQHVVDKLGLTQTWAPATLEQDGYITPDTQWEYDAFEPAAEQGRPFEQPVATHVVGKWQWSDQHPEGERR